MGDGVARVRCVVVAYGQAGRLAATLDSIVRAGDALGVPGVETVVVLGPSDPDEAARARGVRVLLAGPDRPHTPGANRNAGAAGASAEYLCFADGDVVLEPDFLKRALARLDEAERLGGVGARIHERQWDGERLVREIPDLHKSGAGGPVEWVASAWVARRSAFEAVGGFDARLPAEEDVDLCVRLADAGHPVESLDARAAFHDCAPRPSWSEFGRRWKSGLYAGQGLLLRTAWGGPHFARHLRRQRLFLGAFAFTLAGLALAVLALADGDLARATFAAWLALAALVVAVMALRKRSLVLGALSVAAWVVLGAGIVHAFARGPRSSAP